MTIIRGPQSTQPIPPQMLEQLGKTGTAKETAAPGQVDSTVRVTGTQQQLTAAELGTVVPPQVEGLESVSEAARSFSHNLIDIGRNRVNGDAMMLAFLKLQILEASRSNWSQMLSSMGRSTLRKGAIDDAAHSSADAATAARMEAEADGLDNNASADKVKADKIASDGGADPAELEQLYHQSVAAGKGGNDVVARYEAAHADDPDLAEKLAAVKQAEPYYRSGAGAYEDAEEIRGNASGLGNAWMAGAGITLATRMGTDGMHSILANAEAQQKLANDLMALLSGMRPDAQGREDALRDAEKARIEIGQLILALIDAHGAAKAGARTSFR